MRKFRRYLYLALAIMFLCGTDSVSASKYAGAARIIPANGITALISTPQSALDLVDIASSGVSNWISTIYNDSEGKDWLQAGWLYYWWHSIPKQYVEYCIDCQGEFGTYFIDDQFASQNWGSTIDYWIDRETNNRWCAYTAGVQRHCIEDFHSTSVDVYAESEVHESIMNPLNTTFSEVRYKDPVDSIWKLFDTVVWVEEFPYAVEEFSTAHFRTYRVVTNEIFLPIIIR